MALVNQLKAIEQSLLSSTTNAQSLTKALTDLQAAAPDLSQLSSSELGAYSKTLEAIKKVDQALKGLGKTGKEHLEQLRKNLESVTDKTKRWVEELAKAGGLTGKLATGVLQVSHAASELSKTGDVGQFIQQMTAGIPIVSMFGFVIGAAVSTQIKFQDQLRQINRTFIDAAASTGQFARGLGITEQQTKTVREGLAEYEKLTGLSRDQTLQLTGALAKAGMSFEEMGIDDNTGKVKTFGEALEDTSGKMGAFSTAVAMARSTGMDFSQTVEQIGFQTKQMGEEVSDAADMFVMLQRSADRSKLSTQILLPIVRGMQEQYKFLGIESTSAARAVGLAGEAARRAGLGPGMGAALMGRAVGGLMGAGLGVQAFLGQQMRMGGGLAAGFAMRQRPAEAAMGLGDVARSLFGGRGVSREQAAANEQLAGMRAGQELMISQLTGLNQLESSAFLDMSNKLKELDDTGQGQTEEAQDLKKKMADATRGEGEYRARTLTAQEKMARLMEVLTATLGKVFMTFMTGFLKGMGREVKEIGGIGESFNKMLEAAIKGEGIDTAADMLETEMKKFEGLITPVATDVGEGLGALSGSIIKTLIPVIRQVTEILGKAIPVMISAVDALGGLQNVIVGGGLLLGFNALTKFLASGSLVSAMGSLGSTIGSVIPVLMGPVGLIAAFGALALIVDNYAAVTDKATKDRIAAENQYQGHINNLLQRTAEEQSELQKKTGKSGQEAIEAVRQGAAKSSEELVQAMLELQKQKAQTTASGPTTHRGWMPWSKAHEDKLPPEMAKARLDLLHNLTAEIQALSDQIANTKGASEILRATAMPKPASKDAWDINRAGWLYASRGDVVVDASSLAKYMGTGQPGSAMYNAPDMNQMLGKDLGKPAVYNISDMDRAFGRKPAAVEPDVDRAFGGKPAAVDPGRNLRGGGGPVEQEVIIHLIGVEDKLGQLFDTYLQVNIENGTVQVGKEGVSKMRHGSNGPAWR